MGRDGARARPHPAGDLALRVGAASAGGRLARDGDAQVAAGTTRLIDGQQRVYYEGYWIKTYPVPDDTLQAKKHLIEALPRRLFNHTEHGACFSTQPPRRFLKAARTSSIFT